MGSERFDAAYRAASAFLRDDSLRRSFPVNQCGERHVLVVLSDDLVGPIVSDSLDTGLPTTLVVDGPWEGVMSIRMMLTEDGDHDHDDDVFKVHPDIQVKMLLDALWAQGGSLTMHVSEPEVMQQADFEVLAGS